MVLKNKNTISTIETVSRVITHLGFAAMFAATVVGMADLAERESHKAIAVLQPQPVYAFASELAENTQAISHENAKSEEGSNPMLRRAGKEETHHTSATYGSVRRSHSVAGTL